VIVCLSVVFLQRELVLKLCTETLATPNSSVCGAVFCTKDLRDGYKVIRIQATTTNPLGHWRKQTNNPSISNYRNS
jgi:hypothetical protein